MGIFDFLKGGKKRGGSSDGGESTDRFAPVSADDEMLIPQQVCNLSQMLHLTTQEILGIADTSDPMLPECGIFLPNLLMEFQENPRLAMVHGLGSKHAWIRVSMLTEVLGSAPRNYQELFNAFAERGYDVRKVRYIRFQSALKS